MPVRVPCRLPFLSSPAPPRGFEPLISSSTARRALRAAPRGRVDRDITTSGPGGSRTLKHLLLKQAALPVCLPGHPQRSLHNTTCSSTRGGTRTHGHPVLSRAARPLAYPGMNGEAEAVRLDPTSGVTRRPFSRRVPDPAGWLPTASSSGGRNRTCDLRGQSAALRPAVTSEDHIFIPVYDTSTPLRVRGAGIEPADSRFKAGDFCQQKLPPRAPCGGRTRLSGMGSRCLDRSAKGAFRERIQCGVRGSNPRRLLGRQGSCR
jgi:hypothetical protein